MNIVGWVVVPSEPLGIAEEAWLEAIERTPALDTRAPQDIGKNPFTGQPVTMAEPRDATIVVDGENVGDVLWQADRLQLMAAEGAREEVLDVAKQLAADLGGELVLEAGFDVAVRDELLAGVDDIAWTSLDSAVGSGAAFPEALRKLLSASDIERAEGMAVLDGTANQGCASEAGARAFPFLLRMLSRWDYPERDSLVYEVVVGLRGDLEPEEAHRAIRYVLPHLRHPVTDIQLAVIDALARVPQCAEDTLPALSRALALETDEMSDVSDHLRRAIRALGGDAPDPPPAPASEDDAPPPNLLRRLANGLFGGKTE